MCYTAAVTDSQTNERAKQLARFLDDAFEIPGTRLRVGWDGIIGLIPGIGDLVTTLLSLLIVQQALLSGAPPSVIARMLMNIGFDTLVGSFPVLGDLLDFGFKSNRRNLRLLEAHVANPRNAQKRSRAWVAATIAGFACVLIALGYAMWKLFAWLIGSLGSPA